MSTEFLVVILGALIGLGLELLLWQMDWLWHDKGEPKRDPRNMRPPF
ncbi:MAG: hypothetical protein ABW065_12430 [Solirubrobacterales bacterium]